MLLFRDHARAFASQGFPVHPCKPDKTPILKAWQVKATTDPTQIDAWSAAHPDAVLALSVGAVGLVVVDVDVKAGKVGATTWSALEATHGATPTYRTRTDSGGYHLYYRGAARTTASALGPDVDTRGAGGFVIAYPPEPGFEATPIADAPTWLVAALGKPRERASAGGDAIGAFVVPAEKRRAVARDELLRQAATWPSPVREDAHAVCSGAAWGEKGSREVRLSHLCVFLMRDFPWLDADATSELFAASCRAVDAADQDPRGTHTAWVAEKLEQKRFDVAATAADKAAETSFAREVVQLWREAQTSTASPGAAAPNTPWVVGTGQGYFLRADDSFEGPFAAELLPARARDTLAAAPGVVLGKWWGTRYLPKTTSELMHEYGFVPRECAYTLTQHTSLDGDRFVSNLLSTQRHEPARHAQIERWLELFAGANVDPFLDWLATFRLLARPTCALFVKAFPGVGKGLLVDGLANIFGPRAVPFAEAVSPFNGALVFCPLVIADETLTAGVGLNAVDELKKLVGDSAFRVANKNVKATTLHGCLRVLLMSNHHGGFRFGRELTEADVSALDQRVLMLEPTRAAAAYLTEIGGRAATDAWVAGGALARHVAWLESTRRVAHGSRFLIEGRGGLATLLASDSKGTLPILDAIINAAARRNDLVKVLGDEVWVAPTPLDEQWDTINPRSAPPHDQASSWDLISVPGERKVLKCAGKNARYRRLNWQVLHAALTRRGLEVAHTEADVGRYVRSGFVAEA